MKRKNNKTRDTRPQPVAKHPVGISKAGRKVIAAGLLVLVAGYCVLTRTDPGGQNWASVVSPFLILGGYVLIGIGIIVPDSKETLPS